MSDLKYDILEDLKIVNIKSPDYIVPLWAMYVSAWFSRGTQENDMDREFELENF